MIVRGLSMDDIVRVVNSVPNVKLQHIFKVGKGFNVKLGVASTKNGEAFYRLSPSAMRPDKKVSALCWHGFRAVIREWYAVNPSAVIITAMARYDNFYSFAAKHSASGDRNVGSAMHPRRYRDACACKEN